MTLCEVNVKVKLKVISRSLDVLQLLLRNHIRKERSNVASEIVNILSVDVGLPDG